MKVRYYWTADGTGELCALDKVVTEQETRCYHCDAVIPANSRAVKLRTVDGEYILHTDCALKSCNQHPSEQGMYKRLEKHLKGCWPVLAKREDLQGILENAIKNIHFEIHTIYEPDPSEPFADCYMAAVELFTFGQTYRLYFKINENNQIEVEHLERWYFG